LLKLKHFFQNLSLCPLFKSIFFQLYLNINQKVTILNKFKKGRENNLMSSTILQNLRIRKNLSRASLDQLNEINNFVEFLLQKSGVSEKKTVKLKGFWKNSGLEKIAEIDSEIKKNRRKLSDQILIESKHLKEKTCPNTLS